MIRWRPILTPRMTTRQRMLSFRNGVHGEGALCPAIPDRKPGQDLAFRPSSSVGRAAMGSQRAGKVAILKFAPVGHFLLPEAPFAS